MRRLFSLAFVLLAVVVAALKFAEWTSEAWWMNSLGYGPAQSLYWRWRVEAFVPAFGLWMLVMGSNARLAWHNARWRDVSLPLLGPRSLAGRNQISSEDRVRLDSLARRGEQVFIALSALLCGMAAANQFDLWVLAFHPPAFAALASGADATFLVGVWPALVWAWNAFGVLLAFTLGLVITIAAFEGVLDFDTHGLRVGDATARHIAFLTALLLMWIGVRCGLSVLGEPVNFGWSANGISGFYERCFTNPTRGFFLVSSPLLAFYFARAAPRRALRPTVLALFWSANALFLPLMAPSFGRALRPPSSSPLATTLRAEQANHINLTRRAWGLERVQQHQLKVTDSDFPPTPQGTTISSTEPTPGMVVWPQQGLRGALDNNDTGSGLGPTGEGRRPSELYIAREGRALRARVIESDPLATSATSPLLWESDPSRAGKVTATRRELKAVILQSPQTRTVSARLPGADTTGDSRTGLTQAKVRELETGAGEGVARPNALTGLTLALRFGDRSLLEGDKLVTWHLDPLERVQTLAPFVWWADATPHPVWMRDGQENSERLFWLVEGCFVSHSFPHAAMLPAGDEWSNINYARQSVLGVCDATSGKTQFFLFDPEEPFSRAWNALLPGFFRPLSELPTPLRAGTRLSPSLLNVQTILWARYHPLQADSKTGEVEAWRRHSDDWRPTGVFDTSQRDTLVQQVLIERGGKPGLELLSAFSPWGGTLPDSAVPTASDGSTDRTPLIALLSASDEGEAIWKGRGQPPLSQWRGHKTVLLPLSDPASSDTPTISFPPEFFAKFALVPLLDKRNDCIGLQISHGSVERQRVGDGYLPWTLSNRIASTRTQFVTVEATGKPVRINADLLQLRELWKSWKEARAGGQWKQVEQLEAQINRLLGP